MIKLHEETREVFVWCASLLQRSIEYSNHLSYHFLSPTKKFQPRLRANRSLAHLLFVLAESLTGPAASTFPASMK